MVSQKKLFIIVFVVLVLAGISLSACTPMVTLQPTLSLNPTTTLSPTATQATIPTIEPTETMEPPATLTPEPTETPEDLSDITDAMLAHDREEALKAATALISSLPNASQEEIVETLLRKWLAYYTMHEINAYLRLKDYKFEQVTIIGNCPRPKNTIKFAANVVFSVQTVANYSGEWAAGGGNVTMTADHWIYHKSGYVSVTASDGVYILQGEGVPPCSD